VSDTGAIFGRTGSRSAPQRPRPGGMGISRYGLAIIFGVALLARGLLFSHVMGDGKVFLQPDSAIYLTLGKNLLHHGQFYPEVKGIPTYLVRTPGYPVFLAVVLGMAGGSLHAVVAIQILLDSLTCCMVSLLGERIRPGLGMLCGLLAGLNLGMITYCHFLLSDSLFLFLFVGALLLAMKTLESSTLRRMICLGALIGAATLVRPVTAYFPVVLFIFMAARWTLKERISPSGIGLRLACGVLAFFALVGPWMLHHQSKFGRLKLTAQSGEHALFYIVPFSWQYSRNISFIDGMKAANEAFHRKVEEGRIDLQTANPFDIEELQTRMALDYLRNEPKSALVKAWLFGMVKNLFAPAVVDMSYLLQIDRPHFFYTEGKSVSGRVWNFVAGMKGLFGIALVGSMALIVVARLIQLWGFRLLMSREIWKAGFLAFIAAYFLLISGPVGYMKYRLPLEPVLIILLAMGIRDFYGRWIARDGGSLTPQRLSGV
jgi:hypothetical protein